MSNIELGTAVVLDPFDFPDAPPGDWSHAMDSEHSYTEGGNAYTLSDPLVELELSDAEPPVALCALIPASVFKDEPVQIAEATEESPGLSKDKNSVYIRKDFSMEVVSKKLHKRSVVPPVNKLTG